MTAISNFTQAMKELTGFDEEPAKAEGEKIQHKERLEFENEQREEIKLTKKLDIGVPLFDEENGSLITDTMTINGDVVSSDQIKVNGRISGDLRTSQFTEIKGTVLGNISSGNLTVNGAVKGDMVVDTETNIEGTAVIIGDVTSKNLLLRGKVKGNLKIAGTTGITEGAILSGDIDTGELYTEKGCIIHGTITTRETEQFNFEEEKLFNIGE